MTRSVSANTVHVAIRRLSFAGALLCAWPVCCLADDYDFYGNWPTHVTASDGTDVGLAVLYQYDLNQFSNDDGRFEDASTNRRRYLGLYVRKPGLYDAIAQYDFQAKQWADAFVRVRSSGVLDEDLGNVRVGYSKTPVGFEGVTSTSATTFIETALPTQAVWEGRRAGVDWALVRTHFVINVGDYFWRKDFDGNNPGAPGRRARPGCRSMRQAKCCTWACPPRGKSWTGPTTAPCLPRRACARVPRTAFRPCAWWTRATCLTARA